MSQTKQSDELLLIAEKVGELSDAVSKMQAEFAAQAAPIDASKATIDGAVAALNAALTGIRALNFHVLDNNLGAVSKRVDEIAKQADVAFAAVQRELENQRAALAAAKQETAHELSARDEQRTQLAAKRDADVRDFAAKVEETKKEFSQRLASLADSITKFEVPSSFNPRGDWDALTEYKRLDVVSLNGTSYVAAVDTKEKPGKGSRAWTTLARRGAAAGGGGMTPEPASLQPLTAGATIAWDLINPVATITLGSAANALTFNNGRAGGTYVLILKQDGNGSRTVTWPSAVRWPNGTTPTLTTTPSRADVFSFVYDGSVYYGASAQNYTVT